MKIFQNALSASDKKSEIRIILGYTAVFLYSVLALSMWSNYLLTVILKFPFFVFEVYFIPPLVYYFAKNGFGALRRCSRRFIILGCGLVICLFIGIAVNTQALLEQVTTYRVWFYFLVIGEICINAKKFDWKLFYAASFGAVAGDTLYCVINPLERITNPINLMALAFAIALPVVYDKFILTVLTLGVGFVEAFLSSFRISFVVLALAFAFALLFSVLSTHSPKSIALVLISVCGVVVLFFFFDEIFDWLQSIFHLKKFRFIRISSRLKSLMQLDFVASQDTMRLKNFKVPFEEFFDKILINGLVGKGTDAYGSYKDIPILFLYDAFGSVLSWIITGVMAFAGIKTTFRSYRYRYSRELGFLGVLLPAIVLMYVTNGCFLMDTYEVCFSAVLFGYWFNSNIVTSAADKKRQITAAKKLKKA